MDKNKSLRFALIGNPNCGKTTLFNQLTGSSQHVGNWPGVTVEQKEGEAKFKGRILKILDLPGIYSLSPYSPEEVITRNYLLSDPPDVIINIVDATNIERNLYLTTQLAELGLPMIIALNMVDLLERKKDEISFEKLEKELGMPLIAISASRSKGIEELINAALLLTECGNSMAIKNIYTKDINFVLQNIENILKNSTFVNKNALKKFPNNKKEKHNVKFCESSPKIATRWSAIKLFEEDILTEKFIAVSENEAKKIDYFKNTVNTSRDIDRQTIIADQRYRHICKICNKVIKKNYPQGYITGSDRIDRVVTNRFLAIPIFFCLILLIFSITFGPFGNFLKEKIEWLIECPIALFFSNILITLGASNWAQSLVLDGIIKGVGAVISFLPQVAMLFTLLFLMEDSGYMARAAFIMDKLLRKIGLSGRAFVPILMGFGCTVSAVMGTRILENERDKRLTIFMIPFMSCSAKMTIYALLVPTFFSKNQAIIIFLLYVTGIMVGVLSAFLLKKTILKGPSAPFIMELPPYRLPSLKSLWLHVFDEIKDFLTKAGTVLISSTIIIWFFNSFNFKMQFVENSAESMIANIAAILLPIFIPCGLGDWRISLSLVSGLIAKESVVSTMQVLYKSQSLQDSFSPLSAYSFLIFVLLYVPCIAAISTIKQEFANIKWTLFLIAYQLTIAWCASVLVFQIGRLIFKI